MSAIEQDDFAAEEASHLMHAELHEKHPELYEPLGVIDDLAVTFKQSNKFVQDIERINNALKESASSFARFAFTLADFDKSWFKEIQDELLRTSPALVRKKLKGRERYLRAYRRRGQK